MLKKIFSAPFLFCFVLFLVLPACISYQLQDPFITPRVILIAATMLLLSLVVFFRSCDAPDLSRSIPVLSFLAFLILYAISISKSLNPGDAWYEWMKTFLLFPVMLVTAALFRKVDSRLMMLKFSQVCVLGLSAFYFFQWINFLNHKNLEFVFDLRLHIASTLGNKNFYAESICMLFPFSVISFFSLDKKWKALSVVNVILLIGSLVLTRSYAALGAFLTASVFVSWVYYFSLPVRKVSQSKVAGIAAAIVIIFGFGIFKSGVIKSFNQRVESIQQYIQHPEMMDATTKTNSNSTFERIMLWRNSFSLIKENPVTGCGANNWKLLYPKFGIGGTRYIEAGNVHYEHPHNDYLLIAAESGIPALFAFLIFLASMIWISMREMKKNDGNKLWFGAIMFAAICFMAVSIFSFPRMRFYGWILLGLYAGLLYSFDRTEKNQTNLFSGKRWKFVFLLCAALCAWTLTTAITRYRGEVHSKLLQIAKKQRNFSRVVRESEKATSWYFPIDETATPFTWYKGMALFYSGNVSGARIEFENALRKNPYHIQLLNDLATSYEQTNERDKAISLYQRALSITPYFPQSLLNISACYFNIGRKDSAFIYIDKLYGIKLAFHEKTSYDIYLPAILREKIYMEANMLPEDDREKAVSEATDSAFVNTVYRLSKGKKTQFLSELAAAQPIR